jgi:hypothetical protein
MAESYMNLLNNQQQVSRDVYAQMDKAMSDNLNNLASSSQFEANMTAKAADFAQQERMSNASIQASKDRNFFEMKRNQAEAEIRPLKMKNEALELELRKKSLANSIDADNRAKFSALIKPIDDRFQAEFSSNPSLGLVKDYAEITSKWMGDMFNNGYVDAAKYNRDLDSLVEKNKGNTLNIADGRNDELYNALQLVNPAAAKSYLDKNPFTKEEANANAASLLTISDEEFAKVAPKIMPLYGDDTKRNMIADRQRIQLLRNDLLMKQRSAHDMRSRAIATSKGGGIDPELQPMLDKADADIIEASAKINNIISNRSAGNWQDIPDVKTPTRDDERSKTYREFEPKVADAGEYSTSDSGVIKGMAITPKAKSLANNVIGEAGEYIIPPDAALGKFDSDADRNKFKEIYKQEAKRILSERNDKGALLGLDRNPKTPDGEVDLIAQSKVDRIDSLSKIGPVKEILQGVKLTELGYNGTVSDEFVARLTDVVKKKISSLGLEGDEIADLLGDDDKNAIIRSIPRAVTVGRPERETYNDPMLGPTSIDVPNNFGGQEQSFLDSIFNNDGGGVRDSGEFNSKARSLLRSENGAEKVLDLNAQLVVASIVSALRDKK